MSTPLKAPLLIARHARAAAARDDETDFERALDATGRFDAAAMAARLVAEGLALGHVVASSARRCVETAAALSAPQSPLSLRHDDALYPGGLAAYGAVVEAADPEAPLTIVGHNPSVEQLARHLMGEAEAARHLPSGFPPGGILCLERAAQPGDPARFVAFLRP